MADLKDVIAKTQELISAPSGNSELNEKAQVWLKSIDTENEYAAAVDFVKVLESETVKDNKFAVAILSRKNLILNNALTDKIICSLQVIVTQLSQQSDGHLIQSRIFAGQGLTKLAEKYAEHSTEERGYVEKCIDRIIDLGGEVKLEDKKSAPVYNDAEDFLKYDLQISKDGLNWLLDIVKLAQGDLTTFGILSDYYKDEEKDMYETQQQLDLIKMIGKENWLAKQI